MEGNDTSSSPWPRGIKVKLLTYWKALYFIIVYIFMYIGSLYYHTLYRSALCVFRLSK